MLASAPDRFEIVEAARQIKMAARSRSIVGANGNTLHALPLEPVLQRLHRAGRL